MNMKELKGHLLEEYRAGARVRRDTPGFGQRTNGQCEIVGAGELAGFLLSELFDFPVHKEEKAIFGNKKE